MNEEQHEVWWADLDIKPGIEAAAGQLIALARMAESPDLTEAEAKFMVASGDAAINTLSTSASRDFSQLSRKLDAFCASHTVELWDDQDSIIRSAAVDARRLLGPDGPPQAWHRWGTLPQQPNDRLGWLSSSATMAIIAGLMLAAFAADATASILWRAL